MKYGFLLFLPVLFFNACGLSIFGKRVRPNSGPYSCLLKEEDVALKYGNKSFPAIGKFFEESHLTTNEDEFSTKSYPSSVTEKIQDHMNRSCSVLQRDYFDDLDCSASIYAQRWEKEWTPSEGGKAGQGSSSTKPSVIQEMWAANMMWTASSKPKPGDKWLVSYGDKHVVVAMGFETGPADSSILGGYQPEVQYALGASNSSPIKVGRLEDQSLPYGPVSCYEE